MTVPMAVLEGVLKKAKASAPADTSVLHELDEILAEAFKEADPEFDASAFLEAVNDGRKPPRQWLIKWKEPNGVRDERVIMCPTKQDAACWLFKLRPYLMRCMDKIDLKVEAHRAIKL